MPKATTMNPATRKVTRAKRKLKLGGRKSAVSAHGVSTNDLILQLASPKRRRDVSTIRRVLRLRGVRNVVAMTEVGNVEMSV